MQTKGLSEDMHPSDDVEDEVDKDEADDNEELENEDDDAGGVTENRPLNKELLDDNEDCIDSKAGCTKRREQDLVSQQLLLFATNDASEFCWLLLLSL